MRLVGVVLVFGACGGHGDALPPSGDGPSRTIDAPSSIDSGPTADAWQWQTLISNNWSTSAQSPGQGGISCASIMVNQDMWVDGLRSSAMTEENDHQFLILTADSSCNPTSPRVLEPYDQLLYGAGLGSNELDLPAGTAVHIAPAISVNGTLKQAYLMLYDHVVNTGSTGSGTSTVDVHVVDSSTVQHDVDLMLAGQGTLDVPANDQLTNAVGKCDPVVSPGYSWNVVALWPHMHESGTHATVSINGTNALDTAYAYTNEQPYMVDAVIDPMQQLSVTCTLQNAGSETLSYNEFNPETAGGTVCWTGVYKWPTGNDPSTAQGVPYGPETCVDGSPAQYTH
jgi:hypothetical protein